MTFARDRIFDSIINAINNPVLSVVVHSKEVMIISLLKTLSLSPEIIFMIVLFL